MPSRAKMDKQRCNQEEEDGIDNRRRRYKPVKHIYSSTAPCVNASGSSNVMSKKVKARKIVAVEVESNGEGAGRDSCKANPRILPRPPILQVYRRRTKVSPRLRRKEEERLPFVRNLSGPMCNGMREVEVEEVEDDLCIFRGEMRNANHHKRRRTLKNELIGLGSGAAAGPRSRRTADTRDDPPKINVQKGVSPGLAKSKKWVQLSFDDADPLAFVGLQCKVFWPMDDEWYLGTVKGYNSETLQHQVEYNDGDAENLILSDERINFSVSSMEMHHLNLKCNASDIEKKTSNYDEMLALAVSYDDCQDFEAGDIVWAKLSGYAMWPALVISETCIGALGILKPYQRQRTVSVQFFGTHDFARINIKQVESFFRGLLSSFHLKCKNLRFERSLEEAKMYLSQQQLPSRMIEMQNGNGDKDCSGVCQEENIDNEDISSGDEESHNKVALLDAVPFQIGDLCVTNLGKVVFDSEHFRNKHVIWPDGYTAVRKFMSISNPNECTSYKMEVLRNPKSKERPLFRITLDDGVQIEGPNPTICWREIYNRIQRNKSFCSSMNVKLQKSGSYMFGFSVPKISQLIQAIPYSSLSSKKVNNSCVPFGYRAVRVEWTDIDRCNVCHMDEEYDDNLFLQCDKCRMTVHARCYGEVGPLDGFLWFCNFCRSGGPKSPPPCCLCPVIGGAMKPTTDGRWAHLTCAMWIPETCLLDIQRMEPIDGVNTINKDRWKLLCNICGVPYGACIQCCYNNCYASYHPLCARAAGLCVELETEDQLHLQSVDENDDGCIRLLSFCKKHRQTSDDRLNTEEQSMEKPLQECSAFNRRSNSSGCSRTEPYMFCGRRGRKEPQVLVSASTKRLFIENTPYLVSGCCQNDIASRQSCGSTTQSKSPATFLKLKHCQYGNPHSISSMGEKYQYMKKTYKKRLAFGKSQIHGFGVFAKIEHKAGDMVIEYVGELVRPPIADIREHRIYNSLVGAGTYMFRIDNERVVDATKAGSIAHLINHSCEPNCYSRMITVNGDEHIIIFAKRDICKWEELTYDYRFFSRDEQLSCFCGSSKCLGVVNDIEAQEQITNLWVPRSELIPWQEE